MYRYSIDIATARLLRLSSVLLLLWCMGAPAFAQLPQQRPVPVKRGSQAQKDLEKKEEVVDTIPWYNGTYVGVDLFGIGNHLFGSDYLSSEVSVAVNLKNQFIPSVEVGMGQTDSWSDTGIHYTSKASPYFRIGVDYNTMAKKKDKNNYLYAGLRYAFSSFKYDVLAMPVADPVFGGSFGNPNLVDDVWGGSMPYDHTGMKGSMQWLEIVLGVKIRIYKNLNMGWSARMKYKTKASTDTYANPFYVPGYGKYNSSSMSMTYSIIYKLPY